MLGFTLTPEQEQLKATAREFSRNEIIPVAAKYDETEEFPYEVIRKAWEVGLMNYEVPQEYGGLGLGVLDTILCLEELNYGCSGMATIIAVNDLASTPLLLAGSDAQKKEYFGRLMSECCFGAYALMEPGSGSDAASVATTYRHVGDEYVLNGCKIFIEQANLGIEMVLRLFSRAGLTRVFDAIRRQRSDLPGEAQQMLALEQAYVTAVDPVIEFLQGRNPSLGPLLARPGVLPQGPRFAGRTGTASLSRGLSELDRAKQFATFFLEDLADLVQATVSPQFALSRYAEHIARSASSFDTHHRCAVLLSQPDRPVHA